MKERGDLKGICYCIITCTHPLVGKASCGIEVLGGLDCPSCSSTRLPRGWSGRGGPSHVPPRHTGL